MTIYAYNMSIGACTVNPQDQHHNISININISSGNNSTARKRKLTPMEANWKEKFSSLDTTLGASDNCIPTWSCCCDVTSSTLPLVTLWSSGRTLDNKTEFISDNPELRFILILILMLITLRLVQSRRLLKWTRGQNTSYSEAINVNS